jgi:hypothetical protein
MAITSTRITVGTEAVPLVPVSNQPQRVSLLNAGGEVVRIGGGPDVTTAAYGLPRLPDNPNVSRTPFFFDLNPGEAILAVVAANTSEVNVWIQVP